MAVIPQIILSGAISPLNSWSEWLALIGVSTYWGKRGLDACLPLEIASDVPPKRPGTTFGLDRSAGVVGSWGRVYRGFANRASYPESAPRIG
jgi:hypothetical protein